MDRTRGLPRDLKRRSSRLFRIFGIWGEVRSFVTNTVRKEQSVSEILLAVSVKSLTLLLGNCSKDKQEGACERDLYRTNGQPCEKLRN